MKFSRLSIFVLFIYALPAYAGPAIDALGKIEQAALMMVDAKGNTLYSKQVDQQYIPASTVKLLTAFMALEHWGTEHRFSTKFYVNKKNHALVVKGLGDPFLISEEIDLIVEEIKHTGIQSLSGIQADISYFSDKLAQSRQVETTNSYDAAASALAANFNTIEVKVVNGEVSSGERQTPLTPMAKLLAVGLPEGRHRINLGNAQRGPQYFVELLRVKLLAAGVLIEHQMTLESSESDLTLLFTHKNSHTLGQVVAAMLEYSNNFIANQLFLLMGASILEAPATMEKAQTVLNNFVNQHFDWQTFAIQDGAGLSRENRLSARQLIQVVQKFAKYRDLVPVQKPGIKAKSGTLQGVSCYAGYVWRDEQWMAFALMINQPVEYRFRERLAEELRINRF